MERPSNFLQITLEDFAQLFATTPEDISCTCMDLISSMDFRYRKMTTPERDKIILEILERIDSGYLPPAGGDRKPEWERGWTENLVEFVRSGYDINKLVPKYFKRGVPARYNRDYVLPVHPDFILNCTKVFRTWLFRRYFQDVEPIYEFGCGSATHLAFLATLFPEKRLYGLDWTRASQEIIQRLEQNYGWRIAGYYFNLFDPDSNFHLDENGGVFTFGAMEQIGKNYEPFLQYLLKESPALCINVECLIELYDPDYLSDYLALRYHRRRNYLEGYLTRLKELQEDGVIEIIKVHHQRFGNIYNDSHSYVVWKPRGK